MLRIAVFMGFLMAAAHVWAAEPSVMVKEPWARAPIGLATASVAYAVLADTSGQGDILTGVDTVNGGNASLHETTNDGGVMRMRARETLVIPAKGSVELKAGGTHIMLMNLPKGLKAGDTLPLRLHFKRGGDVVVNFALK